MINSDKFGRPIYGQVFQILLKIGIKIQEEGYFESIKKPNLFCKQIKEGWLYADMRGTKEIPIWEQPAPLFYWNFNVNVPFWLRRRFIETEIMRFIKKKIEFRLSFEIHHSEEFSVHNATEGYFINAEEGVFYWENGFCKNCGRDFSDSGFFCNSKCQEDYLESLKNPCKICGRKIELSEEIIHHISYFPEKTIFVHRSCHNKIHKSNLYPELKPSQQEIDMFYKK